MDMICLYFPRLGVDLARRKRPQLAGRPVVLIAGHGQDALVTSRSAEAGLLGVLPLMTAGEARRAAPCAVFLPDNPADREAELERVATLAGALGAPMFGLGDELDRLFIPCPSAASQSEAVLAERLAGVVASTARIGSGPSAPAAFDAARASRRIILPAPMPASVRVGVPGESARLAHFRRLA
jgi:nucleotidyltransferase/DNA polymerase involved in DNA repair